MTHPTSNLTLPTDRLLTVADMLRLADVCERDGYANDLGTNIRRAFAPSPTPNPSLPGGWRDRCVVCKSERHHAWWGVYSPDGTYSLSREGEWVKMEPIDVIGSVSLFSKEESSKANESSARAALAAAEPWPGYVEPEAWREWAKWTDYSSDRGQYESLCGKWRWAYTLGGKWRSIAKEDPEGKSRGYSEASERAIHHPPTVPPPDYTPPKPASDGTVDAADVAANAGLYINDDGETFRSDGMGIVTVTMRDGQQHQWGGVRLHQDAPATRFRPLPKPESKPAAMPWPGYVEPKPASDGTVDAAFVAANAGEYDGDNGNKYRSDGAGSVLVVSRDTGAVACQWRGADRHAATRFLPLPKPESKPARETLTFGKPGDPIICTFHLDGDRLVEWSNDHLDEGLRGNIHSERDLWIASSACPLASKGEILWLHGDEVGAACVIDDETPTRTDVLRWGASIDDYNAKHRKPAAMPGEGERIKRYLPWPQGGMALSDDGDYVKHSDHLSSLAAARAEVERMRAERDEARRAGADAYAQSVKVQGWMSEETDKNGKLRSDLAALKVRVDELGVIVDKARALARHSNYHQEAPGSLERALHDALFAQGLYSFPAPPTPTDAKGEKGAGK